MKTPWTSSPRKWARVPGTIWGQDLNCHPPLHARTEGPGVARGKGLPGARGWDHGHGSRMLRGRQARVGCVRSQDMEAASKP